MGADNEETQTSESAVANRLKAEVGYFDGELKTIPFNQGDNIQTLINKADLDYGDGQSVNDEDGEDIQVTDQAEENKTYYIVGNYKQGK